MSHLYALVYLTGLIILIIACRRLYAQHIQETGTPLPLSNLLWALPEALVLAFLTIWGALGLITGIFTIVSAPITCTLITLAGIVTLRRDEVWGYLEKRGISPKRRTIALVVLILVLSLLTTEVPYNSWLPLGGPTYFWLEMTLEGLLLSLLYFLGQRHAAPCLLGSLLFLITGLGQHFVKRFKNAAILPTDLLVLDTAVAVTGEYVFSLNEQSLAGITCFALLAASLALVPPPRRTGANTVRTVATNVAYSAASAALLAALVLVPYEGVLGVRMRYWYSIDYYQMQGFMPSFIYVAQDMPIKKPKGYTDEVAEKALETHARAFEEAEATDEARQEAARQFSEIKPSVICVMNESFADLSRLDKLFCDYEGPTFFKTGMKDALRHGTLNVTVHGAGTCNTEFEFLCGYSLSFIGVGKYPFSVYDLSDTHALPQQFKGLGYHTAAIHPNYPTNWNRHKIYPAMGFDDFYDIDDFGGVADPLTDTHTPNEPHAEIFHSGVTDEATYDLILVLLKTDEEPLFVFDVTMANHGGYEHDNIPKEWQLNYQPTKDTGEVTLDQLNEYLSCVWRSDEDLKRFVEELKTLDRPVVLVFFGDHQPSVSMTLNDLWYQGEPEDVHARRVFATDYVIWANYDVAGRGKAYEDIETSVDMLASQTLELIGAPLTTFEEAQLDISRRIPALSASGYLTTDGTWHTPDDEGPYSDAYHDLSLIEYLDFVTSL